MSSRLRAALAAPDSKSRYVRRLFSTIAERYDLITRLLSYGQDRRWKARVAELAAARPGMRALDLACGTGDIAFTLAARGADVVGLDITHRMLQLARAKGRAAQFETGDRLALPFGDETFDLVTTGYGLRKVPDIPRAIAEMQRVL
jgi:demethylmenaquinone methyltransferase/2-methoxy-6-polyprenyl-1,4-benzoquinol methylase